MPKTTPVPEETRQSIIRTKQEHPNWSGRQIAPMFELHHKTVNRILKHHLWNETARGVKSSDEVQSELVSLTSTDEPDFELSGEWVQNDKYVYNGESDTYITFLKCRPKPLVISGTKFRSMKKSYSDWDGKPATINEICRRFAIPRDQFMELKAVHGWTHEAEPFTREEVMSREVDDLADDAFQQRRQAVWEGFEKKRWHQTKIDAEKWNNLEQSFIAPLQDHLSSLIPVYSPPRIHLKEARHPF